jgi:hypothetical protein
MKPRIRIPNALTIPEGAMYFAVDRDGRGFFYNCPIKLGKLELCQWFPAQSRGLPIEIWPLFLNASACDTQPNWKRLYWRLLI